MLRIIYNKYKAITLIQKVLQCVTHHSICCDRIKDQCVSMGDAMYLKSRNITQKNIKMHLPNPITATNIICYAMNRALLSILALLILFFKLTVKNIIISIYQDCGDSVHLPIKIAGILS